MTAQPTSPLWLRARGFTWNQACRLIMLRWLVQNGEWSHGADGLGE